MDKINDMIGRACYEAFYKDYLPDIGTWDGLIPETKDLWISAGCAARNVLIPNVATESQPVDDFLVGRPSPS